MSPAAQTPPADAHAAAVTVAAAAVGLAAAAGLTAPLSVLVPGLAAVVAVVGLPHGGLDGRVGRAVFAPALGPWWPGPFLSAYLLVGGLVVAAWAVAPLATIALFFALSAFHFGETEAGPWWRAALFGGMVVWLPLLARPDETLTLLGWVTPAEADLSSTLAVLRPALLAVAGVAAGRWAFDVVRAVVHGDRAGTSDCARLLALAGMFAAAPVLLSFAVYFAGWHSLRELGRLARRADPGRPAAGLKRVLVAAAPSSLAAAGLVAGGAWLLGDGRPVVPAAVQAVFLGLSAVAVPHILLHAVAARAGADPFARAAPGDRPGDHEAADAV